MARSYRKPYVTDYYKGKRKVKRLASKAVRRFKGEVNNGSWFKRLFQSWDIDDFGWYTPTWEKGKRK